VESWKGAETQLSIVKVVITAVSTLWNMNMLKTIVVLIGKHPVSITGTRQLTFRDNLFSFFESQMKHHVILLVKNYIKLEMLITEGA
jgi:hypothetical protein